MEAMMVLQRYIDADSELQAAEKAHSIEREVIYSGLYPQYEVELGFTSSYRTSTENAALQLIDLDHSLQKVSEKCMRRRKLLSDSLRVLSESELAAFNVLVWEQDNGMTIGEARQYERQVMTKLCNYIEQCNANLEEEVQAEHKQGIRRLIKGKKVV